MKHAGTTFSRISVDDLSEKISVLYYIVERNERGDMIKSEEIIRCMVWAQVLPLTGKISDSTPVSENVINYRITIRYRQDLKPDDEIIWRGRRLKITTPPFDIESRHIWTQFNCEEVIQDGKVSS